MTSDLPLVSVVLPTYNREAFLREAVDSVLAQTYPAWELIVMDDGSTDGTQAYLSTLTDQRVRVALARHDGNRARLRNQAIGQAGGEYVAFLDSDDVWEPVKLERQVSDLRARHRRWGYTHHTWIDDAGDPVPPPEGRRWKHCDGWILRDVLAVDAWIALPSVITERSLLAEAGYFDESLLSVSDYEAWVRLATRAPAGLVAEPLVAVRLHAGNRPHHSTIEVKEALASVYYRLVRDAAYRPMHRLCRERLAAIYLTIAASHRASGRVGDARRSAMQALRWAPWRAGSWGGLARAVAQPLLPGPILTWYRRARARARARMPTHV